MYKFLEKLSLYTSHKEYMENLIELNQVLTKLNGPSNKSYSFTAFRDDMLARQVGIENLFNFEKKMLTNIFL